MSIGGLGNPSISFSSRSQAPARVSGGQPTRGGVTVAFEQAESARSFQRGMRALVKLEGSLKELRATLQVPSYGGSTNNAPTSRELGLAAGDEDKALQDVAAFSEVSTGAVQINGVEITIDVASDSLTDVISRINSSGADVTASLGSTGQRLVLDPTDGGVVSLTDTTSNLFEALEVQPLTYDGGKAGRLQADVTRITRLMRETSTHLNALFKHAPESREPTLTALTDLMRGSATELLEDKEEGTSVFNRFLGGASSSAQEDEEGEGSTADGQRFRTRYGVHFNFRGGAEEVMVLGERERAQLRTSLRSNSRAFHDFFKGDGEEEGLLDTWLSHLKTARERIQARRGSSGLLVSRTG